MTVQPRSLRLFLLGFMIVLTGSGRLAGQSTPVTPGDLSHQTTPLGRVIAIGDLHGDLAATRAALRLGGAIDSLDHWIGQKLQVVQVGDVLDRGDDEIAIRALFRRLSGEAERAGGGIHLLNGNHEFMNVLLDFHSTSDRGLKSFQATGPKESGRGLPSSVKKNQRARALAFLPGGPMALELATQPTILSLGGSVFVHGGLLPWQARWGVDSINHLISDWLKGNAPMPNWLRDEEQSPAWTRLYSKEPSAAACDSARTALGILHAKRMIVGHSRQMDGIVSYCDDAVWAIDVGMTASIGGRIEVLEIEGDTVHILGPVDHPSVSGKKAKPKSGKMSAIS